MFKGISVTVAVASSSNALNQTAACRKHYLRIFHIKSSHFTIPQICYDVIHNIYDIINNTYDIINTDDFINLI